jgi:pyruvate dehydrogenase E2 component (dihydrolipoamide acetyltransferase)
MTKIQMPQLSEGMKDGKLLQWNVQVGDTVRAGDTLAEIEADKANMEIEATVDGTIVALHGNAGDTVAVGSVLVEVQESEVSPANAMVTGGGNGTGAPRGERTASPLVRRVASQKGIDLEQVTGTGPDGEVLMQDVESYIAAQAGR